MMENGSIGLVSSHFMDSDREAMSSRHVVDEEEEFYDFLPFQKEFLIPLRDRAFSWDVSFEDEIHGDNEGQPIGVISEQQDSHRLVIKAKASGNKRQAEPKEIVVEAAEPATKKGKAAANSKKKDGSGITSPVLQANKANLKTSTASSSSSSGVNGRPQAKTGAASTAATKANNNAPNAKVAAAARKIFNVASSPSSEMLDTQTLRNTLNNAKSSSADKTDFGIIKSEFADLPSNNLNFGFGNEFETEKHNVAFDDALSIHFNKEENDFQDLADETFTDDFRPPRKLSWSIDFSAIEAAMGGGLLDPVMDGSYQAGDSGMNYQNAYSYDGSGGADASGVFPSLLRSSDASGSSSGTYSDHMQGSMGSNVSHNNSMGGKNANNAPGGMNATGPHGQPSYGHSSGNPDHSSSGNANLSSSMMNTSMVNKSNDRDQLSNHMSSGLNSGGGHPHGMSSGLNMSGSSYANSLNSNHPSGINLGPGALMNGDSSLPLGSTVGGLTLGGLTVPNDGEFRVGAYTKLERHIKIEAFREKKRTRIWRKQIKYDCRKRLADTRPRVKGRFVSRKGDKGGDGGDDLDVGPDGMDGSDQLGLSGPPLRQLHSNMQGGGMSSGNNGGGNQGMSNNANMHHGHGNGGMHKLPNNGSYLHSGNVGDHSAGMNSGMMGIKTEMKYSGNVGHSMQTNSHLQQQTHQQGHSGHNMHGGPNHSLPSIPRMENVYNPAGNNNNNTGNLSGPHLNSVRPGMVGSLSASSSSSAGTHHSHPHPHAPPHSLLSQAQQQKLQQQQAIAQNALQQHQLQQQQLQQQLQLQQQQHLNQNLNQSSQQQHPQHLHGQGHQQMSQMPPHQQNPNQNQNQNMVSHPSSQQMQRQGVGSGPVSLQHQTQQQQQQQQAPPSSQHQIPHQGPHPVQQQQQQQHQVLQAQSLHPPQLSSQPPMHPQVSSGLLLSGPSAAHLHSTSSTTSAPSLAALPSVASHTTAVSSSTTANLAPTSYPPRQN